MALSADSTSRRLAKALLYLAQRFGHEERESPSAIRTPPFSHKLLAQYIGSTRAAVTRALAERTHTLSGLWLSIQSYNQAVQQFVAQLRRQILPESGECQTTRIGGHR